MVLKLDDKKAIVAEVAEVAKSAVSIVAADYRGLQVYELTALRSEARNAGVYLRVVRNTLAKRALEGTEFACMNDALVGPLILAFSKDEPSAAARIFKNFIKDHEALEVKALSIGGELLPGNSLDKVASLPTKDEAIAQLLSVMQAPITKFVQTLAAPHGKLVRTLVAVKDAKN